MTDPTVTIRTIYDAFARGDIATVLGAVLARLADEWNPFHVAPDRIVADRDTVIAVGTYTGTHNASGRSVRARFAHVWELRDSNIIAFEQIADTAKINEAT